MSEKIPQPHIYDGLSFIDPANSEETLQYKEELDSIAEEWRARQDVRLDELMDSSEDSVDQHEALESLMIEALPTITEQILSAATPEEHDEAAHLFTDITIAIFGQPKAEAAQRLVAKEYRWLLQYRHNPEKDQAKLDELLEFYRPLAGDLLEDEATELAKLANKEKDAEKVKEDALRSELAATVKIRYGGSITSVESMIESTVEAKQSIHPSDILAMTQRALEWLVENDQPAWSKWSVEFKEDGVFSVYPAERLIKVGKNIPPYSSMGGKNCLETIIHELLGHALPSVNGYGTQESTALGEGLPGYLSFREGLATLLGAAIAGTSVSGIEFGYRETALALGTIDGQPLSRKEMLEKSRATSLLDARNGKVTKPAEARNNINVNNIYRGGRGDGFGEAEAILTKTAVYYDGYRRAVEYIQKKRDAGFTMEEIVDYLSLGQFDPARDDHVEAVFKATRRQLVN